MKNNILSAAWAVLYVICAALSFIPEPVGVLAGVMVLFALAFFVPPAMLLYAAAVRRQWKTVALIRNLSLASLGLTLVMLVVNFLSVGASEAAGEVLFGLLILVSAPLICAQAWVLSLFLWACLLMVSLQCLKKRKNR